MDERLNDAPCGYMTLSNSGTIEEINRMLLDLLGYAREEALGRHVESILSVANKIFFHTYFYPMLQLNGRVDEFYLALKKRSGEDLPVLMNAARRTRNGESYIDCAIIQMSKRIEHEKDMIVAAKKLEELNRAKDEAHEALKALHEELGRKQEELIGINRRLEDQASTDGLTGARNRRFFQESLAASLAAYGRTGIPFSLMLLDIDYFKKINDTYGHPYGDEVLKRLAALLRGLSRETDVVARYGGEEFAVILAGAGAREAAVAGERYREAVEREDMGPARVTISVGVAEAAEPDDAEALISRADRALYRSKGDGRNRVTVASE